MRISDYAFLSDCQSAALVNRDGSIDWYCLPRFDSPSVFSRILDPGAGHWSIRPQGDYDQHRSYLKDTLVIENIFETSEGSVSVTDALSLAAGLRGHEIGLEVPHTLLRVVRGLSGEVDLEMEFSPAFEYGLSRPNLAIIDTGLSATGGPLKLDLITSVPLEITEDMAKAGFKIRAGETIEFGLAYSKNFSREAAARLLVDASLKETIEAWRSWADLHKSYDGLHMEAVRRSALVLQGLTYQPSGAVVAAPTTSLPEKMGGEANWDYRFAWLRDISLMMSALWVAACPDEPARFFEWITMTGLARDDAVQIMYGIEGERDLSEHQLDHLEGFAGSRPVRVGNEAWRQKQLDVMGEVLDAAFVLKDLLGTMGQPARNMLIDLAGQAERRWREPDAGMWEARDKERHYTSSKVMCWVALDRAIRLKKILGINESQEQRWRTTRDDIKSAVLSEAWNPQIGAYGGAFGSDHLDASVLLMPLVGFLPATDERMRSTIELIYHKLCDKGVVRRWQEEENGFIICNFWLVECLALAGELERAKELFEKTTALANDVGLLSEEVDSATGELLGNFPQAFSHVGLINAAWRLSKDKQ